MNLLDKLIADHPQIEFLPGETFVWSPEEATIYYESDWHEHSPSLLHELGHALEEHQTYQTDIELLKIELDAWERAKTLAKLYDIEIDEDHIQNCLDTYRDWLNRRSRCPECEIAGIQSAKTRAYTCINCSASWHVPETQQCIVRRRIVQAEPARI